MERRDVLKKIGLMSALGATGLVAFTCESKSTALTPVAAAQTDKVVETAREKLIVNRQRMSFADPDNPTKAELKHTPQIDFEPDADDGFVKINVVVGSQGIIHPATAEHWIDYLTFFVNGKRKSHIENENGEIRGNARFWYRLKEGDVVKIELGCNLHGIWENTKEFNG